MWHFTYVLQFQGEVTSTGVDGNILRITTAAPGCTFRSWIGDTGVSSEVRLHEGSIARCDSDIVRTGTSTFQEAGSIFFGSGGHLLQFSTVGSGWIAPASVPGQQLGAAVWRVEGGDGQFSGAGGLISTTFTLDDQGHIVRIQAGALAVRQPGEEHADTGFVIESPAGPSARLPQNRSDP